MLAEKEKTQLKKIFSKLKSEVRIVMFTQEFECQFCKETKQLVLELGGLAPALKAEVYDFSKDKDKVNEFGVDKIPAIAVIGAKNYGIRFYGTPSGYEFNALVDDIVDASTGKTRLSLQTKEKLSKINKPIHIQVFTTPTCPYCPAAVRLAHQFAIESEQIRADMVEVIEFPFLGQRYSVMGVPKIVIDDSVNFVGAVPEERFVEYVLAALSKAESKMFI